MLVWYPQINDARRDSDFLPDPPTPTSSACPDGLLMIRVILQTWFSASSKSTRSIWAFDSLYSSSAWSRIFWSTLSSWIWS